MVTKILHLSTLTFGLLAATGSIHASEKIRFEDIPSHMPLNHRGFNVFTIDGKQHHGRALQVGSGMLRVIRRDDLWEDVPASQVARIEVTQAGRYVHNIADDATAPVLFVSMAADSCFAWCAIPVTAAVTPLWAYAAARAPFFLAADFVGLFIPPKVYEIEH